MTRSELLEIRDILEARLKGLGACREDLEVEHAADPLDAMLNRQTRERKAEELARQKLKAREIEEALRRISRGYYGMCDGCGERISPARLAAVPETLLCKLCKDHEERLERLGLKEGE